MDIKRAVEKWADERREQAREAHEELDGILDSAHLPRWLIDLAFALKP